MDTVCGDFAIHNLMKQQKAEVSLPILIQNHSGGDSVASSIGSLSPRPPGVLAPVCTSSETIWRKASLTKVMRMWCVFWFQHTIPAHTILPSLHEVDIYRWDFSFLLDQWVEYYCWGDLVQKTLNTMSWFSLEAVWLWRHMAWICPNISLWAFYHWFSDLDALLIFANIEMKLHRVIVQGMITNCVTCILTLW